MSGEAISEITNPDLTAESKDSTKLTADNQEEQEEVKEDNKAAVLDDPTASNQPSDQLAVPSENKEDLLESDEPKSKVVP